MNIPFLSFFSFMKTSPFDGLLEHAEKVKECAWVFQQALECYVSNNLTSFEEYRVEVSKLESEADAIKRRIRGHIPMGTKMVVPEFQFFMYLKEQDKILDSVETTLDWLSYRVETKLPEEVKADFLLLVDSVLEPIEQMSRLVKEADKYFKNYSDKQRNIIKDIIRDLRQKEHEVDRVEYRLKNQYFGLESTENNTFHFVKLVETIGSIADHAENAGDMMRSMISRKKGFFF